MPSASHDHQRGHWRAAHNKCRGDRTRRPGLRPRPGLRRGIPRPQTDLRAEGQLPADSRRPATGNSGDPPEHSLARPRHQNHAHRRRWRRIRPRYGSGNEELIPCIFRIMRSWPFVSPCGCRYGTRRRRAASDRYERAGLRGHHAVTWADTKKEQATGIEPA